MNSLVALLLCTLLATTARAATPCSNLPGWFAESRSGIDLANFNPFPTTAAPRTLVPVVEYTCDLWYDDYTDKTWDLPDQLFPPQEVPGSATAAVGFAVSSTIAMHEAFNEQMSISSCGLFSCSSASASYAEAAGFMYNKSMAFGAMASRISSYSLKMAPPIPSAPLAMDPRAFAYYDAYVGGDPTLNATTKANYDRFVELVGTHYLNESMWGGWAMSTFETQRTAFDAHGSEAVAGEAKAAFLNCIHGDGGGGASGSVAAWFTDASSVEAALFFGGKGTPTDPASFAAWSASVSEVPYLTSFTAVPISELLPTPEQRGNMSLYIQDRLDRALVNHAIIPAVYAFLDHNFYVTTSGDPTCAHLPAGCPSGGACATCFKGHPCAEMHNRCPNGCVTSSSGVAASTVQQVNDASASLRARATDLLTKASAALAPFPIDQTAVVGLALEFAAIAIKVTSSISTVAGSYKTVVGNWGDCGGGCATSLKTTTCGSLAYPSGLL